MQGHEKGDDCRMSGPMGMSSHNTSPFRHRTLTSIVSLHVCFQVNHYERRRKYLQFKAKIEKGDYDPVEEFAKEQKERESTEKK